MSTSMYQRVSSFGYRTQRGVATLLVTLSILVILTIIILSSSNVALFEQKTATNENRSRLAEQAAEYALNIGGEYLKANVSKISTKATGGWLKAGSLHWVACTGFTDAAYAAASAVDKKHPCYAERTQSRRLKLYYYTTDGAAHTGGDDAQLFVPYDSLVDTTIKLTTTGVGGTGAANTSFGADATVKALLCRINSPAGVTPQCALQPTAGRRVAVTLIAEGKLAGENATSIVKETWGTISSTGFSASTPLVAAGTINLVGTFTIVDAADAGGPGVAAAVWSPQDVGGNGSWQTCPKEDYLSGYPRSQLTTSPGCAETHPSTCNCDVEVLSAGGGSDGVDILDKDSNAGANPDITFFPGSDSLGNRMDYRRVSGACPSDHPGCDTDDNLFEWIFGVDVTGGDNTAVAHTCTVPAAFQTGVTSHDNSCEVAALSDMGFTPVADCSALNQNSSGLIYVTGTCTFPNVNQIGDPNSPVILVVDSDVTVGHTDDFFGMLFVRSETNAATISGNASGKFFGSIVIEGGASHLNGTMDLVYMDTSAGSPDDPLPETTSFARLPGSWLDSNTGF